MMSKPIFTGWHLLAVSVVSGCLTPVWSWLLKLLMNWN